MRFLIMTAALLVPASSLAEKPQAVMKAPAQLGSGTGRVCAQPNVHMAEVATPPEARPLGELPAGSLQLAVMREVDGCIEPVLVRQGIGGKQELIDARPRAVLRR